MSDRGTTCSEFSAMAGKWKAVSVTPSDDSSMVMVVSASVGKSISFTCCPNLQLEEVDCLLQFVLAINNYC